MSKAYSIDVGTIFLGDLGEGLQDLDDITVTNDGTESSTDVFLAILTASRVVAGDTNGNGQEAVTEKWIEVSLDGVTWKAIGGDPSVADNVLSFTSPVPAASTTIQARIRVPAGATTAGDLAVSPEVFWLP